MRFILSIVLKRTVGFLTTVDVVLEEYKLVVLQSDYKKKTTKNKRHPPPHPRESASTFNTYPKILERLIL